MKSDKYLDNKIFFLDFYAIPKGKYLRGNLVKMERLRYNILNRRQQSVSILADLLTKRGVFATFGGFFGQ